MSRFAAQSRVRQGRKVGEILIYGPIGSGGWFGSESLSAKGFADLVKSIGAVDEIVVRLNSDGGDAADGVAIYNQMRRLKPQVTVEVDSLALSAASVIAMGGDVVRAAENALLMIHDPWMIAAGNAQDLRDQADILDKFAEASAVGYVRRTGKSEQVVREWMRAETWFDAQEAAAVGLVDEVTTGGDRIAARFDPERFRNCPARFRPAASSDRPNLVAAQRRLAALRLADGSAAR